MNDKKKGKIVNFDKCLISYSLTFSVLHAAIRHCYSFLDCRFEILGEKSMFMNFLIVSHERYF